MSRVEEVTRAILPCEKCNGRKVYQYTTRGTPHYSICDLCCSHDRGWWLLKEHYGRDNGKWCCVAGCGHTITEDEYRRWETTRFVGSILGGKQWHVRRNGEGKVSGF